KNYTLNSTTSPWTDAPGDPWPAEPYHPHVARPPPARRHGGARLQDVVRSPPSSGATMGAGPSATAWSRREEEHHGLFAVHAGRGHEGHPRPRTDHRDPVLAAERGRHAGGRALHRRGTGVARGVCLGPQRL